VAEDRIGTRLGHRPALDGLRALAIAAVVPYHWGAGGHFGLGGGFLGVNLFFVLSGFLITRVLLEEHTRTGGISRTSFYRRRIARLLPGYLALLAVVVILSCVAPIFGSAASLRIGTLASLSYVANWVAAGRGFGALGPFAHLWSLALEEQFYLLWPLVMIVALRRMPPRRVGHVAALAAAVIFVQLAVRSLGSPNEMLLYLGTDGQGMAFLLLGCAAALTFAVGPAFLATTFGRFVQRFGVWAIVPILPFLVGFDHNGHLFYYRGVLAAIGVCMVVLVLASLVDGPLSRALAWRPLVYLGQRSYSVYLWHYPVILATNWVNDRYTLHWNLPIACVIAGCATLGLAELSFRVVERPLRRRLARPRVAAVPEHRRLEPAIGS
jgi:peptidoglycan/LPS O-acetylase OafA/YrhL